MLLLRRRQSILTKNYLSICLFMVLTFTAFKIVNQSPSATSTLFDATELIKKIGTSHLDNVEEFAASTDEEKISLMTSIRESMKSLMQKCALKQKLCNSLSGKDLLLTLFTTWVYDPEKFHINNATLFNWKLLPNVNLVVFTNSAKVKYFSELAGFHILPITEEESDVPVLPAIFRSVMLEFRSEYYGYANGDIIFTKTLVDTLAQIQCDLASSKRKNGLLIVGRRINIPERFISYDRTNSWEQLDYISKIGSLFQTNAEDYFITNKLFPWHDFLPVVIGRRGYDNWIVAFSRYNNITVIDATESIQCLHQTVESRGNFEGFYKGDYNLKLIDKLKLSFKYSDWGRTVCAGIKTWINLCGDIVLSERSKLDIKCASYHLSHQIYKLFGL